MKNRKGRSTTSLYSQIYTKEDTLDALIRLKDALVEVMQPMVQDEELIASDAYSELSYLYDQVEMQIEYLMGN